MSMNPVIDPCFFKVLIRSDSKSRLSLPRAFVEKHRASLPENARLRVSSVSKLWNVKLEKMDDGECVFTDGWLKFAEDMKLDWLEFLTFRFDRKSMFLVSVYAICGSERHYLPADSERKRPRKLDAETEMVEEEEEEEETGADNSNPHFEVPLVPHRRSRVALPKKFVMEAGLLGKKKVVLEYPRGRRVSVELVDRSRSNPGRIRNNFLFELGSGWPEFRNANGMVFGKTYSFEYIPDKKVILVKPAEEEVGTDEEEEEEESEADDRNPCFEIVLVKHRQSRVTLPKAFILGAGLVGRKKVALEYPGGLRVSVGLDDRSIVNTDGARNLFRIDLASGWRDFRKSNGLVFGETYSFEYVPSKKAIVVRPKDI